LQIISQKFVFGLTGRRSGSVVPVKNVDKFVEDVREVFEAQGREFFARVFVTGRKI
jgi:hypothetical protein